MRRAFSIIELLVVIAILAAIIAIVLPMLSSAKGASAQTTCLSNLRQLATAFDMYTQNNNGCFPDDMAGVAWDDLLVPHLTDDDVFRCGDDRKYDATGNSYNWRNQFAVLDPGASLAKKNKGAIRDAKLILVFESLGNRHAQGQINAATIDASATPYATADFEINMELKAE